MKHPETTAVRTVATTTTTTAAPTTTATKTTTADPRGALFTRRLALFGSGGGARPRIYFFGPKR